MKKLLIPLFFAIVAAASAQVPTVTLSSLLKFNEGNNTWLATVADLQAAMGAGSGSVTSVALSLPGEFTISGSPVTTSGTLTGNWATQTTNKVFASPNGSTGTPSFRALAEADIPTLSPSKITGVDLTAGSSKVTVTGGTGAVLTAATVDVVEANLTLNNIGGTLGITKGGTGLTTIGGNGTLLGSDGTNYLALSPTITTTAAAIAYTRNGSNIELNLPNADASNRGTVSTGTQTFAGAKTFQSLITGSAGVTSTSAAGAAALYATGVTGGSWVTITATATLDETNRLVNVGTLSADITVNLPACNATRNGWEYEINKSGTDTEGTTLDPNGSEQFTDGATTKTIYSQGVSAKCTCLWNGSSGSWIFKTN